MKHISRYIMTLVALLAVTTGAWADETPLLTIESKDYTNFKSGSKTFDDKVTITFSNPVENYGDSDGWFSGGTESLLTVAGTNGYTITSCKFYTDDGPAKTGYTVVGESPSVNLVEDYVYSKSVSIGERGITKIEVYGTAPSAASAVEVDWNKTTKTGTFTMPAGNVELLVEYYPGMLTLGSGAIEGGTLSVEGLTDPFTKLEVPATWEDDNTLLSAAHLPGLKEMTDAEAEKWTGASSGYVILIYGFDGTKAKMATYLGGEFTNASPEEVTLSQLKTASADAEFYYSSEAQMPAGFEKDEEGNIYVEPGTVIKVKVVPNEGYRLVSLTDGTNDIEVDADGIATITMPDEYADLTLTATFSDKYTVALNAEGLSDEEAANWKAATGDNAPAAFPLENVKYGTDVKVTYTGTKKVIGVKAEKKVEPKKLTVGNVTFYYDEGQTFTEAKQKYADLNSGWILNGPYISVQGAISIVLFKGESPVEGTSKIEPNAEYSWINFS